MLPCCWDLPPHIWQSRVRLGWMLLISQSYGWIRCAGLIPLYFQLLKFDITAWRMFLFFKEKCFWKRCVFFKDEDISENNTAAILLLILLITFLSFFLSSLLNLLGLKIKWSVQSVKKKKKRESYEFVWVHEQSLSEMLKVEKFFTADSRRSLVWFWDQARLGF